MTQSGDVVPKERFVRACERHMAALVSGPGDRLVCPGRAGRGRHVATKWVTFDREKARVLDRSSAELGHEEELNKPVGEVRVEKPKGKKTYKSATLKRAKLTKGKAVLWLRVEKAEHGEPAQRVRVTWTKYPDGHTGGGAGKSMRGTASAHEHDSDAVDAFARELAKARKAGYAEAPMGLGRRPVVFTPVPL